MIRLKAFILRNIKEILRDPLTLAFGIGFPLVLIALLTLIQSNIPQQAQMNLFEINQLAPGVAVFGLSFMSLFAGMLIAKDRASSLLMRLYASPLKASEFILGYMLPMIPMAILQTLFCVASALVIGLKISINVLVMVAVLLPADLLYISIGLLCGSLLTDKQVGGACGALLTNLSAWLSGIWFDIKLVGGVFEAIANALPFIHAVNAARAALAGDYAAIFPDLWIVIAYSVAVTAVAIIIFRQKMRP